MRRTRKYRFLGMNIKGTPAMKFRAVRHDMQVFEDECDLGVLQEFKWRWYWRVVNLLLPRKGKDRWRTFPSRGTAIKDPVYSAQACLWKGELFEFLQGRADVLHFRSRLSNTRWMRAVKLRDRDTGIAFWMGTTHFTVGGDRGSGSEYARRVGLARDLRKFDLFLGRLVASGLPVLFQLDANIHKGTWAYTKFLQILRKHGARVHGEHGVEYLITVNGKRARVRVVKDGRIPTARLFTDHEGRWIDFYLEAIN